MDILHPTPPWPCHPNSVKTAEQDESNNLKHDAYLSFKKIKIVSPIKTVATVKKEHGVPGARSHQGSLAGGTLLQQQLFQHLQLGGSR